MPQRPNITITKGTVWRHYLDKVPSAELRPIGTIRFGADLEGALVFDLTEGAYLLIDKSGARFEVGYDIVRTALDALEELGGRGS
jgi:hypothetical protein